jgi:hypothetical protein
MTSVQRNTTFAIYYEVAEDIEDEYVYFQFVVKYINFLGQMYGLPRVIHFVSNQLLTIQSHLIDNQQNYTNNNVYASNYKQFAAFLSINRS